MSDGEDYLEEDDRTFTFANNNSDVDDDDTLASHSKNNSPNKRLLALDLNLAKVEQMLGENDEQEGIQEQNVLVCCTVNCISKYISF